MKLFKPKIQVFSLVRSKIDFEEKRNEIFIEKTSRSKDKNQQKKINQTCSNKLGSWRL